MSRLIRILLATCTVAAVVAMTAPAAGAGTVDEEHRFVAKINALRESKGLRPLSLDAHLTDVARAWTNKMVQANGISHNPNLGGEVHHSWQKLGENVGRGTDVDVLHQAFIDSPTHYRNLVDGDFGHIGVGVVHAADGTLYTTHVFMTLAGASSAPQAAPAPATEPQQSEAQVPAPAATPQPISSAAAATATPANTAPPHAPTQPAPASVDAPAGVSRIASVLTGLRALDEMR